ncbi:MAG TPA: group I intron-associated PD-(D/E)XK endonuclease [Ktedonobacteraceae bacterium]|nr:group I intron-associated PD-(D/E)XK endonuclease [Ktedonobacteraceae bacterium]
MDIHRPTPKQKVPKGSQGIESEMIIATELVRAGYNVLTPYGYMHRYDLVIEDADGTTESSLRVLCAPKGEHSRQNLRLLITCRFPLISTRFGNVFEHFLHTGIGGL